MLSSSVSMLFSRLLASFDYNMICRLSATPHEQNNPFCSRQYAKLSRGHQLIEFTCSFSSDVRKNSIEIDNDILDASIKRRRKYCQVLSFAQVGIKVVSCRDRSIWWNQIQQLLNVLLAASWDVISPKNI